LLKRGHPMALIKRVLKYISLTAIATLIISIPVSNLQQFEQVDEKIFQQFWDYLHNTSSGLASGSATADGRPLLWKSRDRLTRVDMEFHYRDDLGYAFTAITDVNDLNEYYAGMNSVGFAIENTDAHNFERDNPLRNGWGDTPDDGETMLQALATCRTLDDFEVFLDSLNEDGRTYNFNYGVFDAFGGAAIFECSAYNFTRYDAIDVPNGFLVRSNYAYSGPGGDRLEVNNDGPLTDAQHGLHRHDRSLELFNLGAENNELTVQYILENLVHDVTNRSLDPYPLPFEGYDGDHPYGCVNNLAAICRFTSRAVIVAQGIREGEHPDMSTLWSIVGTPLSGIALPLWVRAGSVPVEFDSPDSSILCHRFIELRDWLYDRDNNAVDTWRLRTHEQTGLWDFIFPLQREIIAKTNHFIRSNDFDFDRMEAFQNLMARQVTDSMYAWRPTYDVNEILEPVYWENNISLLWEEDPGEIFGNEPPQGYVIYRSDEPFREKIRGDSLAYVEEPQWTDYDMPSGGVFYRIEARY